MANVLELVQQLKSHIPHDAAHSALRAELENYEKELLRGNPHIGHPPQATGSAGAVSRPRKPPMMNRSSSLNELATKSTNSSESRPRKPPIRKNVSKGPLLRLFVKLPIHHHGSEDTPEIVIWNNSHDDIANALDLFCEQNDIASEFYKKDLHDAINRLLSNRSK